MQIPGFTSTFHRLQIYLRKFKLTESIFMYTNDLKSFTHTSTKKQMKYCTESRRAIYSRKWSINGLDVTIIRLMDDKIQIIDQIEKNLIKFSHIPRVLTPVWELLVSRTWELDYWKKKKRIDSFWHPKYVKIKNQDKRDWKLSRK